MSKILIAYFSHSENTKKIVDIIESMTNGDPYEMELVDPYPDSYDEVVKIGKEEKENNIKPELRFKIVNFDSYDTIYVGYPNWFGTIPMPVVSFFESYDFTDKKIIPFCTHGGGGLKNSIADIKKLCPNSDIKEAIAIHSNDIKTAHDTIMNWINSEE